MAHAHGTLPAGVEDMDIDPADLEAILLASRQEGDSLDARMRDQADAQTLLALETSMKDASMVTGEMNAEEQELQMALALSQQCPPPEPRLVDDEDSIQKALRESEKEAEAAEAKRREVNRSEDEGELFQAALRASRVDLGPKGISQAAKIMATGDTALGQAGVLAKTGTHGGAGGRFSRSTANSTTSLLAAGMATATSASSACASVESPVVAATRSSPSPNTSSSLRGAGLSVASGSNQSKSLTRTSGTTATGSSDVGRTSSRSGATQQAGSAEAGRTGSRSGPRHTSEPPQKKSLR